MASCVSVELMLLLMLRTLTSLSVQMTEFTAIRLINGPQGTPNSGRVEVRDPDGLWLDVCRDKWNDQDGTVACRHLGYPGYSRTRDRSYYGDGSNSASVFQFDCNGDEDFLNQCKHSDETRRGCNPGEGAGLICTQPGFLGCYTDDKNDRVFSGPPLSSGDMTIATCITHCRQVPTSRYSGLQGRTQCYCGSEIDTDLTKHGKRRKDSDCRDACSGDRDEVCGRNMGKKRYLSVYDVTIGFCPRPNYPAHGMSDPSDGPFHFGSVVNFACDVGYELVGPNSIQCVLGATPQDVVWSNSIPECIALKITEGATTETRLRTTEAQRIEQERTTTTDGEISPTTTTGDITMKTTPIGAPDPTESTLNTETETTEDMKETETAVYCGNDGFTCPAPRNGSRVTAGAYVGLALGCILFIVCACFIVVCLLRGGKRIAEKAAEVAPSSGNNFSQHSAVYGNPEYRGDIPLREIRRSQDGYLALNTSPDKRQVVAIVESRAEPNGNTEEPYLELDGSRDSEIAVQVSKKNDDDNVYTSLTHDASLENDAINVDSARNDVTAYYITIEDSGNEGRLDSRNDRESDNEHYYSYAEPPKASNVEGAAESLYTYADSPLSSNANLVRNDGDGGGIPSADYFVIEEKNNTMGSDVYNSACGEGLYRDNKSEIAEQISENPTYTGL